MEDTKIAIFQKKEIRKTFFNKEWWFSVTDVVGALTDSLDARDYWYRMKMRVKDEENILNVGLPKSAMSAFKKLKIRN